MLGVVELMSKNLPFKCHLVPNLYLLGLLDLDLHPQLDRSLLNHSIKLSFPELNAGEELLAVFLLWINYLAFEGYSFPLFEDASRLGL